VVTYLFLDTVRKLSCLLTHVNCVGTVLYLCMYELCVTGCVQFACVFRPGQQSCELSTESCPERTSLHGIKQCYLGSVTVVSFVS